MKRTEIEEKVINIVGKICIFSSPDDPITEKDNLQKNLGLDFIDRTEIAGKLKEVFAFRNIPAYVLDSWETVGDIINYVEARIETRGETI
jgi:acyl carrier protein